MSGAHGIELPRLRPRGERAVVALWGYARTPEAADVAAAELRHRLVTDPLVAPVRLTAPERHVYAREAGLELLRRIPGAGTPELRDRLEDDPTGLLVLVYCLVGRR